MHVTWWIPSSLTASSTLQLLRLREQLFRGFEVGLAHEDLARPGGHEVLEGRLDCLGVPIGALDPRRPEQAAHHLGLGFPGDDGQDNWGGVCVHFRKGYLPALVDPQRRSASSRPTRYCASVGAAPVK